MQLFKRRSFLSSLLMLPAVAMSKSHEQTLKTGAIFTNRLKTSLNAYSFNDPLIKGSMTLDDLIEFCAQTGFDGVDITGYYFKGYPSVPSDEAIFHVKRAALRNAIEITGTGVRNDFTIPDKGKRQLEIDLVKKWVEVAAKLGAPVLRIFAGNYVDKTISKDKVRDWLIKDIDTCVQFGKQHGVIIGIQNHNDFIQTAQEVNDLIESVKSEWLGLILDTGSYRVNDPYEEIEKSIRHAVNWQIKEKIFVNGNEVDTDIPKIVGIIRKSKYNGYLPIETLGAGDPKEKVPMLLEKLNKALM
jgi:sugar phosphate isomerase/epimerase